MYDKILGCLLGAATGDAMGAATEAKSTGQIKEIFGGRVETAKRRTGERTKAGSGNGCIQYTLYADKCNRAGGW